MQPFGQPPSPPGTPPPPPAPSPSGPPPGISGLVGGAPPQLPQGPTPQQRMEDYMVQIQELSSMIDTLAQDHPEAADDFNQAKNALNNSMSKVAAANTTPDNIAQPPTV